MNVTKSEDDGGWSSADKGSYKTLKQQEVFRNQDAQHEMARSQSQTRRGWDWVSHLQREEWMCLKQTTVKSLGLYDFLS